MKPLYRILFLSLLAVQVVHAQTPKDSFDIARARIFANIPLSKSPTGIVSDYGYQFVRLHYFNGIPSDSNQCSIDVYSAALANLATAHVNGNFGKGQAEEAMTALTEDDAPGTVNLGVIAGHYSHFKPTAVDEGLLTVADGQLVSHAVMDGGALFATDQLLVCGLSRRRVLYKQTLTVALPAVALIAIGVDGQPALTGQPGHRVSVLVNLVI